jgi:tetratricopeptide (TPR) repeat protein
MTESLYEKNLRALEEFHPELRGMMEHVEPSERYQVAKATSGAYRLIVETTSGATVAVHNADDPVQVARTTATKLQGDANRVLVVMGMGLGYLAKELAENLKKGSALIVYEADPYIFRLALQCVDLTLVLTHQRVKVLVGEEVRLEPWCYRYMLETGGEVFVVRFEPALKLSPEIYDRKINKELVRFATGAKINLATAGRFGELFTKRIFETFPHILTANGVDRLKDLFPGFPAVIVAAGPSLRKNCQYLKELKGRAVIIAADTVIGFLLAQGIKPDFVVSVDPQEETRSKYQGVVIPEDVSLVFHPACHDSFVKNFPGPKFVTATSMTGYKWLQDFFPNKGSIEGQIQCQVHMGFNLAQWLGCDPIVLIGLDLSYTDDLPHVKGGSYFIEGTEAAWVEQHGKWTKNIFGEPVRAEPVFFGYKQTWEQKIRIGANRVINATEGGLNIEGTENWLLRDVLTTFCLQGVLPTFKTIQRSMGDPEKMSREPLLLEIRDRLQDFNRLERVSFRLCDVMSKISSLRQQGDYGSPALSRLSQKAERMTSLVPGYAKTLGLLQLIDFDLELYMCREDTDAADLIEGEETEIDRLDKQLQRGLRYYGDLAKAIPILRQQVRRLYGRLRALDQLETSNHDQLSIKELLTRAQKLMAIECHDKAKISYLRLLEKVSLDELNADGLSVGIMVALGQSDPEMAWELAKKARGKWSGNKKVDGLYQKAKRDYERWQKRIVDARPEVHQPSDELFYSGDFYFRLKNYEKASIHYLTIAETQEMGVIQRGEAYFRLSKAQQALGNREHSIEALEQALVMNAADSRVYYDLGVLSLQEQRVEVAQRFFEKGAEVSLDDPAFFEAVGAVLTAAGAHTQAIHFYEQALHHHPQDSQLIKKIAEAYEVLFEPVSTA